jgi:hypothetical protein
MPLELANALRELDSLFMQKGYIEWNALLELHDNSLVRKHTTIIRNSCTDVIKT